MSRRATPATATMPKCRAGPWTAGSASPPPSPPAIAASEFQPAGSPLPLGAPLSGAAPAASPRHYPMPRTQSLPPARAAHSFDTAAVRPPAWPRRQLSAVPEPSEAAPSPGGAATAAGTHACSHPRDELQAEASAPSLPALPGEEPSLEELSATASELASLSFSIASRCTIGRAGACALVVLEAAAGGALPTHA